MEAREMSVVLGSDEHGFVIEGPTPSLTASPSVPDNTLVAWWPDRHPEFAGFVVSTGSQWGPFGVRLLILEEHPGPVDERWQDVVEVSVGLTESIWVSEIVDGPVAKAACEPGDFRMRIAALGRSESAARDADLDDDQDEEDAQEPLEHYLIELWPAVAEPARVLREDSQYARAIRIPPEPDWPAERDAGLKAAWALIRDLRGEAGARHLPGPLGSLTYTVEFDGTRAKLFNRLRYACGWPPCNGGSGSRNSATDYYDATLPEYPGRYEQAGSIAITLLEADKPSRVVRQWNWIAVRGPLDDAPRLLPSDSTVTLTFTAMKRDDHQPRTLVHLTHDGVPEAWVDDLQALWAWDLANRAGG